MILTVDGVSLRPGSRFEISLWILAVTPVEKARKLRGGRTTESESCLNIPTVQLTCVMSSDDESGLLIYGSNRLCKCPKDFCPADGISQNLS